MLVVAMLQCRRHQGNSISSRRPGGVSGWSGLDLIFHSIAFPLDENGLGMVEEPVEDCGSEDAVVVEDLRPVFERAVGGDDDGSPLIALGDDLKEEIGAVFVDGQISELIEEEQ
jgi:hypothetical protein